MLDKTREIFDSKKRFLKRYSRIMKRIERLEDKLFDLDSRLYKVTTGEMTDMPRGGGSLTMDDVMVLKEETTERINALVQESRNIRKEIVVALDELEDFRHVEVLEHFFIEDKSIEEIAEETGYTVRHTIRFYTDAINLLDSRICQ